MSSFSPRQDRYSSSPSQSTSSGSDESNKRKRAASSRTPLSPADAVLPLPDGRTINILDQSPFSPLDKGERWPESHLVILRAALDSEQTIPIPVRTALAGYFGVAVTRVNDWLGGYRSKLKKNATESSSASASGSSPEGQGSSPGRDAARSSAIVAAPAVQDDEGSTTEEEEEDFQPRRERKRRVLTAVTESAERDSTSDAQHTQQAVDQSAYIEPPAAPVSSPVVASSPVGLSPAPSATVDKHSRPDSPDPCLGSLLIDPASPDPKPEPLPEDAAVPPRPFADILDLFPHDIVSRSALPAITNPERGALFEDLVDKLSGPTQPSLIAFEDPDARPQDRSAVSPFRGRPPPSASSLSSLLAQQSDLLAALSLSDGDSSSSCPTKRTAPPGPLPSEPPRKFLKLSGPEPVPRRSDALESGWLREVTVGWFGQGWEWKAVAQDQEQQQSAEPERVPAGESADVEMEDAHAAEQSAFAFPFYFL